MRKVHICALDRHDRKYMGLSDRVHITTDHWEIVLAPFSKIARWDGDRGWWGHEWGRFSVTPRNHRAISDAMGWTVRGGDIR